MYIQRLLQFLKTRGNVYTYILQIEYLNHVNYMQITFLN